MAAPAVVGIPWLASVLGSLLAGLITFLSKYMAAKWAVLVAVVAAISTLTLGMIAAIDGLIAGLQHTVPPMTGWGHVVPDNFSACLGAYVSARVIMYIYYWHTAVLQWRLF